MTDDTEDVKAPSAQTDDDILDEARKRYRMCQDSDGQNCILAKDDLNFLVGGENQWLPEAVSQRKLDRRPIITVNDLPALLHQVTNDQRQNTPSIKVSPADDNADKDTAKTIQGMIRHMEYDSNADVAYDTAVNSAAAIGFGYLRLITDYCEESSFDQDIRFQRIRNALSVKIDPLSVEADGSDMKFCFLETLMSREAFKRDFPEAKASDSSMFQDGTNYVGWISEETVLVCEYYRIEKEAVTVCLLSNGESGFKDKLLSMPEGVTVVKERAGTRSKVMWRKITGADVLETTEIKCKWIPVFPVYGDEIDIEGKVIRSGIIRHAKGPCQSYNVMISGATEEIALRTKAPYIGAEGQFEGHEDEWAKANHSAFPYLEYKLTSLGDKLAPPPQRQPMADIPSGMLAMAMHAQDNKKKTTGLFDASIGARGSATSGKQELAQQREGDMANYHYSDGLNRTMRHIGRCIVNMIPSYYDAERTVRILGEDDTSEHVTINKPVVEQVQDESGQVRTVQRVLNDVTIGKYDITVSSGPSYSTMRQENAEFFANAMSAAKDPATASVVTYLAMKNQDAPGAEEATKMLKKLLPPGIAEPEEGEEQEPVVNTPQGPLPASQAAQMMGQMGAQMQQMEEALKKADAAKSQVEALKQQQLINEQQLEPARQATEQKKLEAEIAKAAAALRQAEAAAIAADADLIRARAEAGVTPQRAQAELAKADTDNLRAQNELRQPIEMPKPEKELPSAEEIAAHIVKSQQKPPKPKAMTINGPGGSYALPFNQSKQFKAPSGESYEVTMSDGGMMIKGKGGVYHVTQKSPGALHIKAPSGASHSVAVH